MAYVNDGEWYVERDGEELIVCQVGSGAQVRLPLDMFDAIVQMRYAQIREECYGVGGMDKLYVRARRVCYLYPYLGSEALRRFCDLDSLLDITTRKTRANEA